MVEYELEGLEESEKQDLQEELQALIESALPTVPIMTIIVTREFTTAVRQFIPIEAGEGYNPVHEYGTAMAKTIPLLRDHHLRFVIIFDSRIIANRNRLDRNTHVLHELVHVKNDLLKFEGVGEEEFLHPRGDKLGMLLYNSQVIWEEYDAERFVAERIVIAARSVNPTATVTFNLTLGSADDLLEMLRTFGVFLSENIARFRLWQMDATALTHAVTSKIVGILVLMAYVYSRQRVSHDIANRIADIERDENYARFFSENWETIRLCLEELYSDRNTYRADILQRITVAYDRILLACGLELSDAEVGFSLVVHDIS